MKPNEHLYLIKLMMAMDWVPTTDLKPSLTGSQREQLLKSKLIELEKRGRRNFVRLSDRGWLWCSENLQTPLQIARNNSAKVLENMLSLLGNWLSKENRSLAEFVAEATSKLENQQRVSTTLDSHKQSVSLVDRVQSAVLGLGKGKTKERIRLATLRNELSDVSKEELDETLLKLSLDGRVHLMSLDNPYEIEPEDESASLKTPSGEIRHILYWVS